MPDARISAVVLTNRYRTSPSPIFTTVLHTGDGARFTNWDKKTLKRRALEKTAAPTLRLLWVISGPSGR